MIRLIRPFTRYSCRIDCWNLYHQSFTSPSSPPPRGLVSVALLGPPNAGKSTLFNRLTVESTTKLKSKKKISGRLVRPALNPRHHHVGGTAIVSSVPGTTRDANVKRGRVAGIEFELIDTAGIDTSSSSRIHQEHWMTDALQQTQHVAQHAHVIFLLVDGQLEHLTADVYETASQLRTLPSSGHHHTRRIIRVLVNKMESLVFGEYPDILQEAERLGFGEPIPISALHGDGMAEIAAVIQRASSETMATIATQTMVTEPSVSTDEESSSSLTNAPLKLAIVGRVNVGKSSLVNQLLQLQQSLMSTEPQQEVPLRRKVMTGPTPGLTRDAIRLRLQWQDDRMIELIDTAGIRKAAHPPLATQHQQQSIDDTSVSNTMIESMAVQEAFHACKTADVVVLVIDAGAGMLQRSELAMCGAILQEGRALVVAANKMDLVVEPGYSPDQFANHVREQLEHRFPLLRKTPIVPMSAISGDNVDELLPVVWDARERWQQQISTSQLNRWIRDVQAVHSHPSPSRVVAKNPKTSTSNTTNSDKKRVRIKYMLQTKGRPPTFLLYCNASDLPDSYVRFLTRHFQDTFRFFGMPVRLAVKQSTNPFLERRKAPPATHGTSTASTKIPSRTKKRRTLNAKR